jgi:hypothetical protein
MLLSASFTPVLVLVFPVWMLTLCVLLFLRIPERLRIPADPRLAVPSEG